MSKNKPPSHIYREEMLRFCAHYLPSPEHEAMLCGQAVNDLTMDDLEAYCELICGQSLRHLAPADYRTQRA